MEWPLPISLASSPTFQPTSHAEHLGSFAHAIPSSSKALPHPFYWVSSPFSSRLNSVSLPPGP